MSDTPAEKAEQARVRRRLLTLGEAVAVLAVLISALTLWNSWRDRERTERKEARAEAKTKAVTATVTLGAAADAEGRRLSLAALRDDQTIQGQTILFPPALKVAAIETTGDPRIEADWFADALRRADKARDEDAGPRGDARLPILVVTRFVTDAEVRTARAYYDLGYSWEEGGLFGGRRLRLKGLSFIAPARDRPDPARLDGLWTARR